MFFRNIAPICQIAQRQVQEKSKWKINCVTFATMWFCGGKNPGALIEIKYDLNNVKHNVFVHFSEAAICDLIGYLQAINMKLI